MNFGEMKKYCRVILGASTDPDTSYYTEETLALFLNEAAKTVAAECQPNRTYYDGETIAWNDVSLPTDDPRIEGRYPLPSSFVSIKAVHIFYGNRRIQLERLNFDTFEERYQQTNLGHIPEAYRAEYGSTDQSAPVPGDIWFGPKPNGVYPFRISLYRLPTPMAAIGSDDKTYEMPDSFHKPVCYCAAMELAVRNNDTAKYQQCRDRFEELLVKANDVVSKFDRTGPFGPKSGYPGMKATQRRRR